MLGTGDAGAALLRELGTSGQWHVVGAFDDRRDVHGREIHGVPVLGSLGDVERLAREMDVREAVALGRTRAQAAAAARLNTTPRKA